MSEHITVIGSNSFSGASFVSYALKQGFKVTGISRSEEYNDSLLPYKWGDHKSFDFKQLDLNKNTDEIIDQINDNKPSYVVNFAAQAMVAESWDSPEDWYQTNVVANVRLHNRLRQFDFIKKYVHVSTPEVYGSCTGLVNESNPLNPSTPYATSRAACDMHLLNFFNNYNFPVVFTRAANVFGPGQQLYRIIPRTILYIKLNKTLQLHGGGHSLRSFIHIDDVARGTLSAMLEGTPPDVFHFSTDYHISIRSLVEKVCEKLNANFEKLVEVTDDRPGKDAAYLLDSTKAKKAFNWNADISIDDGIASTVNWVNEHFETLQQLPMNYIHKK